MEEKKMVSLDLVLGLKDDEITALPKGEYQTKRLGLVPLRAITPEELKEVRKDSAVRNKAGQITDIDEDLMAALMWTKALDTSRTDFDFGNPELLKKLGVTTKVQVVRKLLLVGEIQMGCLYIKDLSGFSATATDLKN